jgi:hypothetical protein
MRARICAGFFARALRRHGVMLALLLAALRPTLCLAADLTARESGTFDPARWEIRFGGFAHGVGSGESGTADVNGEFIVPIISRTSAPWSFLIPRLHAGANLNTAGRTSLFYAGLLWTLPVSDRFFLEGFLDGAIHNGSLLGTYDHAALGCRALAHVGGSLGYRIDNRWSVMLTFDHASNGEGLGLSSCPRNKGLNGYGARVGFSF